jgi:hypothetical protein
MLEDKELLRLPGPREGFGNLFRRRFTRGIAQLGSLQRIAFPRHDRANDGLAGRSRNIGDDQA